MAHAIVGLQVPAAFKAPKKGPARQQALADAIDWLQTEWRRFLFNDALRWVKAKKKSEPRAWLRGNAELERSIRRGYRRWYFFFRDVPKDPAKLGDVEWARFWELAGQYEELREQVHALQASAGATPLAGSLEEIKHSDRGRPQGDEEEGAPAWTQVAFVGLTLWGLYEYATAQRMKKGSA